MNASDWAAAEIGSEPPPDFFCPTRDIAQARVQTLHAALKRIGASPDTAALLSAIAGELVTNCFDHNLGSWHDVAGCWFEHNVSREATHFVVADRGQGFLGSLRRVRPALSGHREALLTGFTAHVSGRAPEQRGRGLTFVVESLAKLPGTDFELQTGDARLAFTSPVSQEELAAFARITKRLIPGTYAELTFRRRGGNMSPS